MEALEVAVSMIKDLSNIDQVMEALKTPSIKRVVFSGFQTIGAYRRAYGAAAEGLLLALMDGAINTLLKSSDPSIKAQGLSFKAYSDRFILTPGLPLDDDETRSDLDALLPILGEEILNKLKSLGAVIETPLQSVNALEPTQEELITVCETVSKKRRSTGWVEDAKILLGNNGNGFSVEELKEQINALKVPGE